MLAIRETESVPAPVGHGLVRPLCPNCGRPMHLSRISSGTGSRPDIRTFGCGECGVWVTEAANDKV